MQKKEYAQKEPLKMKLDYKKKKKKSNFYSKASINKYSQIPKEALIKKAILADYIIQALKYVVDLIRPFSWLFISNPRLKQVFNILSDIVKYRE